jgi:hypothetical protein
MLTGELSFGYLCRLDPRLVPLLQKAATIQPTGQYFCANDVWAKQFKPEITRLVGWEAQTNFEDLTTSDAYDLAVGTIYAALPACKNCGCV